MELFTLENLFTLAMLTLLQAVLGLDNLLYIALESKRADPSQQKRVRQIGIGGAVISVSYTHLTLPTNREV